MLFWFVGGAAAIVWFVFRDPRFDWRLLSVGAVLPDVVDLVGHHVLGAALLVHSVVVVIALLVIVMLATIGRRPLRKMVLALVIGMFLHLVLDGVWNTAEVFWWPLFGLDQADQGVPSLTRPWGVTLALEVVGIGLIAWFVGRFGLRDAERRVELIRHGRVRDN
jgi:hypothetical protein